MIWLAFKALSLGSRLAVIAAVVSALSITAGVVYHGIWERGYDRAISDIAAADAKAVARASAARDKYSECRDAGRRWDQSEGKCQ